MGHGRKRTRGSPRNRPAPHAGRAGARLDDLARDVVTDQHGQALRELDQALQVDTGVVAHQFERVHDLFAADIAGRAGRIGATAEAAERRIETVGAGVDRASTLARPIPRVLWKCKVNSVAGQRSRKARVNSATWAG